MKIGILTFWWSEDNYGQIMQCYALQKYLRDRGHDAFLIRYDSTNDYIKPLSLRLLKALNPVKLYSFFSSRLHLARSEKEQKKRPRFFSEFRNTYIVQSESIYLSYNQLKANPPKADIYIVGSDQVWNFWGSKLRIIINILHAYFLDFGSAEIKRVSYAASWGQLSIDEEFRKEIRPLLERFDYVSVREKTGVEICESCNVKADWVPDPTLLLPADSYRAIYTENNFERPPKKYVFLYLLGKARDYSIENIKQWAEDKSLDIVYVGGNNNLDEHKKTFATIPQWLYLIDHAEYVITNSFHGCVFSIIFHKQFAAVQVKGVLSGMNSRLDSLWELLHISPRLLINNDFSFLDDEYPWINSETITAKTAVFEKVF